MCQTDLLHAATVSLVSDPLYIHWASSCSNECNFLVYCLLTDPYVKNSYLVKGTGQTMILIETDRLILRQPDARDVDGLVTFYNSKRSAMAGGNVSYPEAVTRAYSVLGHWVHRGYGLFAITLKGNDAAIGMAGPNFPPGRPETEIGWVLFDGAEGYGYATEAAKATIDYAKKTLLWTEIVHYIVTENVSSIAVAERVGAELDPQAQQPKPDYPCLVYRQSRR